MDNLTKDHCGGRESVFLMSAASPAASDLSVSAILDKDGASVGCSPAPSNCSVLSELESNDAGSLSRQSPFLPLRQSSPSCSAFTRPDFLNTSMPDSETSSRSSLDGITASAKTSFRSRRRRNSSDSDSSEGSVATAGGESIDGEDTGSRKNSKSGKAPEDVLSSGRGVDAPRGRIAHIRRESAIESEIQKSEVAHERLLKASQKVSTGFDDIALDKDMRKRTPSISSGSCSVEPITIVTNNFLPHSCSPSPTRQTEAQKQCYSPSTQQMVRPNIPYSPSPSPTQSPTRQRLLRSLSPISTRGNLKRRYTASGITDDSEAKRGYVRNSTSPLVTDRTFPYPAVSSSSNQVQEFAQPLTFPMSPNPNGGSFLRRAYASDPDTVRRTSVDSCEEPTKILQDNDRISEPASVVRADVDTDESMDVDSKEQNGVYNNGCSPVGGLRESRSSSDIDMDKLLKEASDAPLPDDNEEDL